MHRDILGIPVAATRLLPLMIALSDLPTLLREARTSCLHRMSGSVAAQETVDLGGVAQQLDRTNPWLGYRHIPDGVLRAWQAVESAFGPSVLSEHLRLLLLHFIGQFDLRFASAALPAPFARQFDEAMQRIVRQCLDGTLDVSPSNDVYLKDLGVVRLRLVPCVSHLLYLHSGVPRRVLFRHPSLLGPVLRMGGVRPVVENHVHPLMLDHFNEEGRERCYELIGELLRERGELRGLMGASWYYDPHLGRVTPRLAYLHDVPARNGASVVPAEREGADSGALARSAHRRALYETGKYQPHNYLMLWPRDDILHYLSSRN